MTHTMAPITGQALEKLPLGDLIWSRDIIYFDGPLLSEFKTSRGDIFWFLWCDASDDYNRWLLFRVSPLEIANYAAKKVSLLELVKASRDGFVYIADYDSELIQRNVCRCVIEHVPTSYLPADQSYFDESLSPIDGARRRDIIIERQWDFSDLIEFPKAYRDAYTVVHTYTLGRRSVRTQSMDYNIRGGRGWVTRHALNRLATGIPISERPSLDSVQFASPGVITVEVDPDAADSIAQVVDTFHDKGHELTRLYRMAYTMTHSKEYDLDTLSETVSSLCSLLALDYDAIRRDCKETINAADLILAFYRRFEKLFEFQVAGKALVSTAWDP
jgi:hypothetical protein